MRLEYSPTRSFPLTLVEALKVATLLVVLASAFVALRDQGSELTHKLDDTLAVIDRQQAQIARNADRLDKLSISYQLLHEDMRNLGRTLHEKRIIRTPEITASARPETEEFTGEADAPEPERNRVSRFLHATGRVLGKIAGTK